MFRESCDKAADAQLAYSRALLAGNDRAYGEAMWHVGEAAETTMRKETLKRILGARSRTATRSHNPPL